MALIHHTAVCVEDMESSLRFWRDGLGFVVLMDEQFEGDWPELFGAPSRTLRSVFLGDPDSRDAGIVELVDLGAVASGEVPPEHARTGPLLMSIVTDVDSTLERLRVHGLGDDPRRIVAYGIAMAVVRAPDGVLVELVDSPAAANLEHLSGASET